MDEKFASAIGRVFEHEGGYRNDPDDPGGETNFGISKRTYPDLDIKSLTRERAEAIYLKDWWERYGYGSIREREIAAKVLDLSVNIGPHRAHCLLQQAINETGNTPLKEDGVLGQATISAVNSHASPAYLLAVLRLASIRFYVSLKQPKFLAGWVRRALE